MEIGCQIKSKGYVQRKIKKGSQKEKVVNFVALFIEKKKIYLFKGIDVLKRTQATCIIVGHYRQHLSNLTHVFFYIYFKDIFLQTKITHEFSPSNCWY